MHHLGIGAAHRGKEILAITDQASVTVIEPQSGKVLAARDIEPGRTYWRNKQRSPGPMARAPPSPKTRLR
jgi:endonuclease/exonuclease/phosphatase family metal-dependent hydrolase